MDHFVIQLVTESDRKGEKKVMLIEDHKIQHCVTPQLMIAGNKAVETITNKQPSTQIAAAYMELLSKSMILQTGLNDETDLKRGTLST